MINSLWKYVSNNQIIAALLLVAAAWFLYEIREILIAIFIAYIIMAALAPIVDFLTKHKLSKGIAAAIAYIVALSFFVLLIVPLVPFFITQVQVLFANFPFYLNRAADVLGLSITQSQIQSFFTSELNTIGSNAINVTQKVFGGLFSIITILVVSFYLLLERNNIKNNIALLFHKQKKGEVIAIVSQIEERLGAWLTGQIVLSLFIGGLTWLSLTLIGLQFALPLAVLAGILEVVPTLGPLIAAVPAVIVALTVSPTTAIIVVLIYAGIQLLENNILVPRIMQKAVGLNPIVVIIGIIIGSKLFGVPGALLSIPFISMCLVVGRHIRNNRED